MVFLFGSIITLFLICISIISLNFSNFLNIPENLGKVCEFFVSSIDLNDYLENDRSHSYFKGIIWSIRSLFTFMQDLLAYNSTIIEILEETSM